MDYMTYPWFQIVEPRGAILPNIHLPQDFEELIPLFYEQGRKQGIEDYAIEVEKMSRESKFLNSEIKLQWHEELGLTNISVGPSGGLDLNERGLPSFQEHNLGTKTGYIAGIIAMKYISELLKTK